MKKHSRFLPLLLSLFLAFSAAVFGQETTGNIEGTITDPNGARVAGATVELVSESFKRTVTADSSGFFRALQLPVGAYTVNVTGGSFQPFSRKNVQVTLGQTTPVNVTLAVAGTTAEVVVTGADDLAIDPTSSRIQTNLTEQQLDVLPKGNGFTSALKAVPSVRDEPSAGGFSIDGATGVENSFILDGQEVGNFRTGNLNGNNNLPFQLVKELQVKNSGFEAEFGGATGGVINVITKSGANSFHGETGINFVAEKLNARPRPILFGTDAELIYIIPTKDEATDFFPFGSIGGPIIKDRAWFFLSATPQIFETDRRWTFQDGSQGVFRTKQRNDYYFGRVDASITDSLRVFSTFTYNPIKLNGNLPTFNTLFEAPSLADSGSVDPDVLSQLGGRVPASNFNINGTWVATPNLVFSARYSRGYINEKINNYGIPQETLFACSNSGIDFGFACGAGFSNIPNNDLEVMDVSIRNNFEADGSVSINNFLGRHQFKAGYQRFGISNEVLTGYVNTGRIQFNFGRTTAASDGTIFGNRPGEVGYVRLRFIGEFGEASSKNESIYVQDSWQPVSYLTINAGVRFERESVPSFTEGFPGIEFGFGDKIAPRVGFAWDVLQNGKWKVFGNYGQFFDRFKYELPRGSFGGNIFDDYRAPLLASQTDLFSYTPQYVLDNALVYTNFRVPSNDPADFRVDPDLKPVRQTEWTFGTQYDLGKDTVLGGRYTHKQIDDTIEDIGYHTSNAEGAGSEAYFIGNPGRGVCAAIACGRYPVGAEGQKPVRKYDAVEVTLAKRFGQAATINASYTFSRLFGNYSGLASTDEFSVNGGARESPNVNRFFDTPAGAFTVGGEPNLGRLPTDRPHVFKFFGAYTFGANSFLKLPSNNEFEVSGFTVAQSGTPITTRVDLLFDAYIPLNGRGDLGRTPMYTQTDLGLAYRYRFGRDNRWSLQFNVDILNVFNESNVIGVFEAPSFATFFPGDFAALGIDIPGSEGPDGDIQGFREFDRAFFDGRITREAINRLINEDIQTGVDEDGNPVFDAITPDARYGSPQFFQGPRNVRFGFRLTF